MRRPIPDDVHRFVLTSVPTVPFLEAMLILRAHATVSWSAAELAARLFVSPVRAEELLVELCAAGLATPVEEGLRMRWNPASGLALMVDRLAEVYADNVVDVTQLIHSRLERRALQFADAFRLRRKED